MRNAKCIVELYKHEGFLRTQYKCIETIKKHKAKLSASHTSQALLKIPKCLYEGGIGIFGFAVLAIFLIGFSVLHQKSAVFWFWCLLRFANLAFGFQFSSNIPAVSRVW